MAFLFLRAAENTLTCARVTSVAFWGPHHILKQLFSQWEGIFCVWGGGERGRRLLFLTVQDC